MLIESVVEKYGARASTIDKLRQRTYTRVFLVETTDPVVGPLAVRSAAGVPQVGAQYSNGLVDTDPAWEWDQAAFCQSVSAQETGDTGRDWEVTCEYGPYDTAEFGADPTTWKPVVSWSWNRVDRLLTHDVDGVAILNTAFQPYDPPPAGDEFRPVLSVRRKELYEDVSLSLAEDYLGKANDAAWNGFAAGVVKCTAITPSTPQWDPTARAWLADVEYSFEINRDTWKTRLVSVGLMQLDSSTPPVAVPITEGGNAVTEPCPLDADGKRLASDADPYVQEWQCVPLVDFTVFAIDLSQRLGA